MLLTQHFALQFSGFPGIRPKITSRDSACVNSNKPFSMVLLGRRITALLRRSGKSTVSDITAFGDVTVDFSGYTAKGPEGKIDITPKEIDLLRLLVEHKGLVLTRSQILDDLWGMDAPIIERTVDTYIKNLRKKLRLDCIVTVKGIGYKYEVQA